MRRVVAMSLVAVLAASPTRRASAEEAVVKPGEGVLEITANGFKDSRGQAIARLYRAGESVLGEPSRQVRAEIHDGVAILSFRELPFGTCAVVVVHDVNDNGRIDHSFLKLPSEPIGFSNGFALGLFSGMPSFERLAFAFSAEARAIDVTVK